MADIVPPALVADFPLASLLPYPDGFSTLLAEKSLTAAVALRQLEVFLGRVHRHVGPVKVIVMTDPRSGEMTEYTNSAAALSAFAEVRSVMSELLAAHTKPAFLSPSWLSETVVALAAAIAAGRHFDRLPVLADALEDAGCDNRLLLDHLRTDADHAHHCWVVDVLRGGGGAA